MRQEMREPTVVVRGDVADDMVAYGHDKLLAVMAHAPSTVIDVELRLDHHSDPARERPSHVEIAIDLDGTPVHARASAPTMTEAVDQAVTRLRRRMEATAERHRSRRLRHRDDSWHHEDRPTHRGYFFPRPRDERTIVRRKTFALRPESIEDALADLETLDHDFFLFVHDETNAEAVVFRAGDGYGIRQRVATPEAILHVGIPLERGPEPAIRTLDDARDVLDESDAPFEFFVDAYSGHGLVVYRRYDGNYGLISPD